MDTNSHSTRGTAKGALIVGALGVVFGDIGTSPLYTIQTVFNPSDPHPITATRASSGRRQKTLGADRLKRASHTELGR